MQDIVNNFNKFKFKKNFLAIRSSAYGEDGLKFSQAGEYTSILNVSSKNKKIISKKINRVLLSYKNKKNNKNEILIQEMLNKNISMSGVIFTQDLNTGAPYYVINYDDISGKTDKVTSGQGEYSNRTLYILRGSENSLRSKRFKILIQATKELEKIMDTDRLDVEFAMDKNLKPYLFQARPITGKINQIENLHKKIKKTLKKSIKKFNKKKVPSNKSIAGKESIYGQMPDWNPAEIIGRTPRLMAYSLYKKIITDDIWALARKKMGYKNLENNSLMVSFAHQPFVDVRLSLNSFLPNTLDNKISKKIINFYIKNLIKKPELHDKIEFKVGITCFSFDINERIKNLIGNTISLEEKKILIEKYRDHFQKFFTSFEGSILQAKSQINILENRTQKYKSFKFYSEQDKIKLLISDCKKLGTLPFSILARHAFISKTILDSFVFKKILSEKESSSIQSGIKTIATDLISDLNNLNTIKRKKIFFKKYGHLRPGTYDLLSKRYDQMSNLKAKKNIISKNHEKLTIKHATLKKIDREIKKFKLKNLNSLKLIKYITDSISSREYAKFIFTKNLSNAMELICKVGKKYNLSREEISYLDYEDIINIKQKDKKNKVKKDLLKKVKDSKIKNQISVSIRLPQILFDKAGFEIIPFQVSHPNFVTKQKIESESIFINSKMNKFNLRGKIVLIENADPGYDWIFGEKINGLITKFGGSNSHMAIRCTEFKIPAAIGCGEQRFELLKTAQNILIDASNSIVKKII